MNGLLMFLGKLAIVTILVALVFGFLLPALGIDPALVRNSLLLALAGWAVWTLRNRNSG
jgi:hypothetical protein